MGAYIKSRIGDGSILLAVGKKDRQLFLKWRSNGIKRFILVGPCFMLAYLSTFQSTALIKVKADI